MIESWEFYPRDKRYLSLPMIDGKRYFVYRNHSVWSASYRRYQTKILYGNHIAHVGSFSDPKAAMRACEKHAKEHHANS